MGQQGLLSWCPQARTPSRPGPPSTFAHPSEQSWLQALQSRWEKARWKSHSATFISGAKPCSARPRCVYKPTLRSDLDLQPGRGRGSF